MGTKQSSYPVAPSLSGRIESVPFLYPEVRIDTHSLRLGDINTMRRDIKRRGKVKHYICHKTSRLCFLITDDRALVQTSLQTFLLEPVEVPGNLWHRRLVKIRALIVSRKIQDMDDLLRECGKGINMLPVNVNWYV